MDGMTAGRPCLVATEPVFSGTERPALAGFLAGHSGLTREAYALELRQFASWCRQQHPAANVARRS
jgi:integrase/recombinase XerD